MVVSASFWRVRLGCAAALLVLCGGPQRAMAQPAAPSWEAGGAEERRTALYREGVDAATAGRWADARDRFREVLAIRTSPKVLFSLAQAEEQLGQVASAQADYGRARDGAKAAGENDVVAAAEQAQRAIEPRVPRVRVVVSGARGATATLDDAPIAVDVAVAVDPGAHRLAASAPGMRTSIASVAIGEGQQLDVPLRLEADGGAQSASAGPGMDRSATAGAVPWRTVGLLTAGAGVLAMGVGAAFGIDAKSKDDQSNSSGCNGDACTAAAASVRRDALSAASASTVAFVVGGVLAAGGVVLWLAAPSGDSGSAVGVSPVAVGGGGGLLMTGAWQ